MKTRDETIHIVGGGIGGLTLGLALVKRGFKIAIYEGAQSYQDVGGGHWLYANALSALEEIDAEVKDEMCSLGKRFDGFRFRTREGVELLLESTKPYTPHDDLAPLVIRRADIIKVLAKRLPKESIRFGKRLKGCEGQVLHFEDGSVCETQILIGADGIHSRVRRDILRTQRKPLFSGQTGVWGISPHRLPDAHEKYFNEIWGEGVRLGYTEVGTEGVYWFLVVKRQEVPLDAKARKAFVLQNAKGFPPELLEAIRKTHASDVKTNKLYDFSPLLRWHKGNVCCIGDAIHACTPNLGQGGCQAIEDALLLAKLLDDEKTAQKAFRVFQRKRLVKTSAVVFLARWLGKLAQMHGPLRVPRNFIIRMTPTILLRPILRWITVG